jgi:uncharacterized delta-60 repeat protein
MRRYYLSPLSSSLSGGDDINVVLLPTPVSGSTGITVPTSSFRSNFGYTPPLHPANYPIKLAEPNFTERGVITATLVVPSGSIYAAGAIARYGYDTKVRRIIKLDQSGSLDFSFSPFDREMNGDAINEILEQPDGNVVVVGAFTSIDGTTRNRVARFLPSGQFDQSFNPNLNASCFSAALQSDGKIVIGGAFSTVGGVTTNFIGRLLSTGARDSTFAPNANSQINALALDSSDNTIIVGVFTAVSGSTRQRIARINNDGTLDTTFVANANNTANSVAIQSDGKILVGGSFTTVSGSTATRIVRLNSDGTVDTSFNSSANGAVNYIRLQSDGKVVIGGSFTSVSGSNRNMLARINSDGTLDSSFDANLLGSSLLSLSILDDDKILTSGVMRVSGSNVRDFILLNSDGTYTETIPRIYNSHATITAVATQSDASILVGGTFINVNGYDLRNIARFDSSGSLDTSFNPLEPIELNGIVDAIAVQPDDKILISGFFRKPGDSTETRIARLNSDGTIDTSFISSANNSIRAITVQPDDKILIGGIFSNISGSSINGITRLNSNGTLDTGFNVGTGATGGAVNAVTLQPDDKILIGGAFTAVSGSTRTRITRINSNGTLDTSFISSANNTVNAIFVQPDDKILIGGAFTSVSGSTRTRITRLNSNGTLDTGFDTGAGANNTVNAISLQSDNKIVIAGLFTTVSGSTRRYLANLNTNGSLNTSFNANIDNTIPSITDYINISAFGVNGLLVEPNDNIFIGGIFYGVNGEDRHLIARIQSSGSLDSSFAVDKSTYRFVLRTTFANSPTIILPQRISSTGVPKSTTAPSNRLGSIANGNNIFIGTYDSLGTFEPDDRLRIIIRNENTSTTLERTFTITHALSYIEIPHPAIFRIFELLRK